ncbi:VOC family protein [Actinoplanes sp. NPDC024001]|uniref:VOC family protein n=1 Tax=Actinoplanes sp. NPDC024001 TaxID=3154598 RepID=UPI003410DE31
MIRWVSAVVDRPARKLDVAVEFWAAVSGSQAHPRDVAGLAGLHSDRGDDYLRVQGVLDGPGGAHLDFAVDDEREFAARAIDAGAAVVDDHGSRLVLASPAGLPFCVNPWKGEHHRPEPFAVPGGPLSRVHQVCVDVAPFRYGREVGFWTALTGWSLETTGLPTFSRLYPPSPIPVRMLLQRLDETRPTSAHMDISTDDIPAMRAWHESLGASFVGEWPCWTTLRDPAGVAYCLTSGDPGTD